MQGEDDGDGMVGRNSWLSRSVNNRPAVLMSSAMDGGFCCTSKSSDSKRRVYSLLFLLGLSGVISFLLMSVGVLDIGWFGNST